MINIALIGFMGTGKTTVGRRLAAVMGMEFVDTDNEIVRITGLEIPLIFKRHGTIRFRSEETLAIKRLLRKAGQVISTGGGIVLKEENIRLLRDNTFVVALSASPEEIFNRVAHLKTRPLLNGPDPRSRIEALMEERAGKYDFAHLSIDTTLMTTGQVTETIARAYWDYCRRTSYAWQLKQNGQDGGQTVKKAEIVQVQLADKSYDIVIGSGILDGLGQQLSKLAPTEGWGSKIMIISNPTVAALYGERVVNSLKQAGFQPVVALMQDGETYKSMESAMQLFDQAIEAALDRKCPIIALGGGVTGDMAGFVAATYMRGVPFIQVPTTLLAQVDSSVGGKVAVNHPRGKNLIGAFYQPRLVWIDVQVLGTLPVEELRAGLGEVVKYGLIWDEDFFAYLEEHVGEILALDTETLSYIIGKSCAIKAQVVAKDEREENLRAILNLGHTFGHALEALTCYRKYRHGEAVALGTVLACRVAEEMGLLSREQVLRVESLFHRLGLPLEENELAPASILESMHHDKKAQAGKIKYVIPEDIGRVRLTTQVPEELVLKVLGRG